MKGHIIQAVPFEFLNIVEYKSELKLNEHGVVTVRGFIKRSKEKEYLQLLSKRVWTEISQRNEDDSVQTLFCGVAAEGEIKSYGDVKELTLKVITGSCLMDIEEHIRSFENPHKTKKEILQYLIANYEHGSVVVSSEYDIALGSYLCQYKETDWQFIKRMASNCSALLIPNYMNRGVKYFFGLPNQKGHNIVNDNEYSAKQSNGMTCYFVKQREIYTLGEQLYFRGQQVIVTQINGIMEGNEIYYTYKLAEANNIKCELIYNEKLIGMSLEAIVVKVEKETVQLEIQENEYRGDAKKWFSYATIYSSPDGTGWYCMPEPGDKVRLYFPSDVEEEAFVMNAVHMESSNSSERINPDYKSIMNKYGKEILITPSSLVLTNNAGMTIELSDDMGVRIVSDKEIEIKSEDAITLMSTQGKIDMAAQNAITLQQGNTSMILSEKLRLQGAKVKLE